ncbi:MAG: hypothetical protein H6720_13465 [Sandaracinus sp.]|nr:hypothetical protein [Sandaracinus sp.]
MRTSAERDDGVCYPVRNCRSSNDCAAGEVCLSELVGLGPEDPESQGFYCVPAPDPVEGCPARSRSVQLEDGTPICVATCQPPDTRCPPGFGCLLQSAVLSNDAEVLCFPGLYGVPCDDDTNCLLGRCLDTGAAGRQCTLSCDEAARLAGGCEGLSSLASVVSSLRFECDADAGDDGLCVTRSGIGFLCTTPESDAYVCAEGLECATFGTSDGDLRICTKDCRVDRDCNESGSFDNYCQPLVTGNVCLPCVSAKARVVPTTGSARAGTVSAACAADPCRRPWRLSRGGLLQDEAFAGRERRLDSPKTCRLGARGGMTARWTRTPQSGSSTRAWVD